MFRVEVMAAAVAVVMSLSLAGCSGGMGMPDWMTPDWLSSSKSAAGPQPLRFESDPPGADVRTAQGQTCQTPCALPVPSEPQAVTFAKPGFLPQTVQVSVGEPPDHSFWESPPPTLVPNPVQVVLQAAPPPPRRGVPRRPHRSVSTAPRTRTAATPRGSPSPFPAPPSGQQPSPFPPPGASPFPAPPQQ